MIWYVGDIVKWYGVVVEFYGLILPGGMIRFSIYGMYESTTSCESHL